MKNTNRMAAATLKICSIPGAEPVKNEVTTSPMTRSKCWPKEGEVAARVAALPRDSGLPKMTSVTFFIRMAENPVAAAAHAIRQNAST